MLAGLCWYGWVGSALVRTLHTRVQQDCVLGDAWNRAKHLDFGHGVPVVGVGTAVWGERLTCAFCLCYEGLTFVRCLCFSFPGYLFFGLADPCWWHDTERQTRDLCSSFALHLCLSLALPRSFCSLRVGLKRCGALRFPLVVPRASKTKRLETHPKPETLSLNKCKPLKARKLEHNQHFAQHVPVRCITEWAWQNSRRVYDGSVF